MFPPQNAGNAQLPNAVLPLLVRRVVPLSHVIEALGAHRSNYDQALKMLQHFAVGRHYPPSLGLLIYQLPQGWHLVVPYLSDSIDSSKLREKTRAN